MDNNTHSTSSQHATTAVHSQKLSQQHSAAPIKPGTQNAHTDEKHDTHTTNTTNTTNTNTTLSQAAPKGLSQTSKNTNEPATLLAADTAREKSAGDMVSEAGAAIADTARDIAHKAAAAAAAAVETIKHADIAGLAHDAKDTAAAAAAAIAHTAQDAAAAVAGAAAAAADAVAHSAPVEAIKEAVGLSQTTEDKAVAALVTSGSQQGQQGQTKRAHCDDADKNCDKTTTADCATEKEKTEACEKDVKEAAAEPAALSQHQSQHQQEGTQTQTNKRARRSSAKANK